MCVLGLGALAGLGGATAAGASALSTLATIATIGGTLYSGISGYQSSKAQAAAIESQATTERALTATQDARQRAKMSSAIADQRAQIAARGIDLSSPTAVYLGQTAAQEMSFDSQAIRSGGAARQAELSTQRKLTLANGTASLFKGVTGAASQFLTAAPDIWPGLARERQLA